MRARRAREVESATLGAAQGDHDLRSLRIDTLSRCHAEARPFEGRDDRLLAPGYHDRRFRDPRPHAVELTDRPAFVIAVREPPRSSSSRPHRSGDDSRTPFRLALSKATPMPVLWNHVKCYLATQSTHRWTGRYPRRPSGLGIGCIGTGQLGRVASRTRGRIESRRRAGRASRPRASGSESANRSEKSEHSPELDSDRHRHGGSGRRGHRGADRRPPAGGSRGHLTHAPAAPAATGGPDSDDR